VGFFTAVFLRSFLGPVYMGIWSMLKVVIEYANMSNLGTISTVSYKWPILKGQSKDDEAENLKDIVFNFVTFTIFICSLGVLIYALIFRQTLSREVFIGLISISILLMAQRVYTYYLLLLRVNKDFTILSKSVVFDAIAHLCLVILIVSRFELYGLFFVAVLMPILNVLFIRRYVTFDLKYSFNLRGIKPYIRFGFPLFISGILHLVLHNIDRIMIVKILGVEQLGFYSIALMAKNYGMGLSTNLGIVIQPYYLGGVGKKDFTDPVKTALGYAQISAYFMSIMLSLVFIAAPTFVAYALSDFVPGISALKIFLLTIFFLSILSYLNNLLVISERRVWIMWIMLTAILVNVVCNLWFINIGWGINGVAFSTAISAFLAFSVTSIYALMHSESLFNIVKFFVKVMFPLFYCIFILKVLEAFVMSQNLILEVVLRALLFILLICPLVLYLNKKTRIVNTILEMFFEKIKTLKNG
jgi:O-antigen/teichoic acid export membrane protein